ncbi:phage late control D family protein [Cloacibacillus evryensis]|jgi:phage protein D|uniref:Late control protein n=2 Tax=Cloacibacillus evryensis TaxID=508460 RepID=A0AAW5K0B5_9BACT|nr:hypothetical protein [Cloacibacillus evryensis]EHL68465.1 hypothetical protein HMPREF1006_02488 [Synergistes sp. 3_1_syn1]MCQ4814250.1 hypothetical protein [Cloacibacillus evryensis]
MAEERDNGRARQARLEMTLAGADITKDIAPFLISFSYEDNRSGEADLISVVLEDSDGRFRGDWFPQKNSIVEVAIKVADWQEQGDGATLKCGTFELDEIEATQGTLTMKGVSVPVTAGGRREKVTKTWEKAYLKTVATDVAKKSGLELKYTALENPYFGRIDQKQESSLEFLSRIVHKAGLAIKIVNNKIAIYNEVDAEKEAAAFTVERTSGFVTGWSFRTQSVDTYKACEVTYFDAKTKTSYKGTATAAGEEEPSGQVLRISNERVESNAEAIRLAEKKLRDSNKREVTGRLDCVGNTLMLDGVVIAVSGFGTFDGKYRIAKSTHSVDGGGYTTSVDLESGPPSVRAGGKGEKKAKAKGKKKKKDYSEFFKGV